ncbi:hypothetical protein ACFQX4_27580 [Roseomonas sp. GCM10028921]
MTDLTASANEAAISWSATMGLIPGYGHDNRPELLPGRRDLLVRLWSAAMEETLEQTGFSVSAVMTDSLVLYPESAGCPVGGEIAVTIAGSSNPARVGTDQFDAFSAAVRRTVRRVQEGMEQTSVRIEFTRIDRSLYSRLDE